MTVIAIDARVKPTTDIFIMNSHYAPSALLENYESFVWTERYDEFGDFEIKYPRGAIDASSIAPGTFIGAGFSDRIMRVERIEDGLEDSGSRMVTIKGVSIESILKKRILWKDQLGLGEEPRWTLLNLAPAGWVGWAAHRAVGSEAPYEPNRISPGLAGGNSFEYFEDIPLPTNRLDMTWEAPFNAWDFIKNLLNEYELGIRFYRNMYVTSTTTMMDCYTGADRSVEQRNNPAIVFSPMNETISNLSLLNSIEDYATSARVWSKSGFTQYPDTVPFDLRGHNRYEIYVNVSETDGILPATQRLDEGKRELSNRKKVYMLDGEIPQNLPYKYREDYNLGDLVSLRDDDGHTRTMRIVEQIFSNDKSNGLRSYPALRGYGDTLTS